MKTKVLGTAWDFSSVWNEALVSMPERVLMPRNYMYASELMAKSYLDRYLSMNGVKPSNPPNHRSLRKFSAGHIFEWIVGLVLTSTGILKSKQLRGEVELPNMLRVSGRLDFIAGGLVDWDKAAANVKQIQDLFSISSSDMPPIVLHAMDKVLAKFRSQFGNNPLKEVVLECKSVSSFMSEKLAKTNKPMPHHVLQTYHYLVANKMDEGMVFYISKDDCLTYQFPVYNDAATKRAYISDIKQMTEYYNAGFDPKNPLKFAPPKEPELLFDDEIFRFSKNFKIEYSNYLEYVYGYKIPKEYSDKWSPLVASYNRVFARCVNGDKMTDKNIAVINEAKSGVLPNWDKMVILAKKSGLFKNEETEE